MKVDPFFSGTAWVLQEARCTIGGPDRTLELQPLSICRSLTCKVQPDISLSKDTPKTAHMPRNVLSMQLELRIICKLSPSMRGGTQGEIKMGHLSLSCLRCGHYQYVVWYVNQSPSKWEVFLHGRQSVFCPAMRLKPRAQKLSPNFPLARTGTLRLSYTYKSLLRIVQEENIAAI